MNARSTTLLSWLAAGLVAAATMTSTVEAQPRRSHRRRPPPVAVVEAPPPPNPLPNSGPVCNALAGNLQAGTDPASLIGAAIQEADQRNDDECRAVIASRQMSMGNCGQASTTIAGPRTRAVGNHFVMCVSGLTRACELSSHPPETGTLSTCSPDVRTAISEIAVHCAAVSDQAAPGAAVHALFELSRLCVDDGTMAATAATIAQEFTTTTGTPAEGSVRLNQAREFRILRNEKPSHHLSDAVLIARTITWLGSGAHDGPNLGILRSQLREYLARRASEPEWDPNSEGAVAVTVGLLGATSRILRDNPSAFGAALEDIILTARTESLFNAQALITARDLQIGQAFRARLAAADARRVESAYTAVSTRHTANAGLLALRLAAVRSFQQPAQADGLSDVCRRARRLTEALRQFFASEYQSLERRFYVNDVQALAGEGRTAAMQCGDTDTATQSWLDGLIEAARTGAPFTQSNINFNTTGGAR